MSASSNPNQQKKRVGRKRLPPLPPGPGLQFVVAGHPDEFKKDETMRNIRSHVMYKHRGEQRGGSKSPKGKGSGRSSRQLSQGRTPSPIATSSAGSYEDNQFITSERQQAVWDSELYRLMSHSPSTDSVRNLVARIIAAIASEPPPGTPSMFEQTPDYPFSREAPAGQTSLEVLKGVYLDMMSSQSDSSWMEIVCNTPITFISHVSAVCVLQDVAEGYLDDTPHTTYAKTKALQMIKDNLQGYHTQNDDFLVISILYLLISEVGGFDEDVFDVHQAGLVRIIGQRGGIANLGMNGSVAAFLSVVVLSFTILRSHSEPPMLQGFVPSRQPSALLDSTLPVSPLFSPHGSLSSLYASCTEGTYQVLSDMQDLTQTFLTRWNYVTGIYKQQSPANLAGYDAHMQQIYARLMVRPSTEDDMNPDWTYEACRLAALIYCRSIVQGMPLSDSANQMHDRSSGVEVTTILTALHSAVDRTDKIRYWGDLRGVFQWICLVGGAASWPSSVASSPYEERDENQAKSAWVRKCFALWAVKSCMGFEFAAEVVQAQRTMLQVQNLIQLKRGIASQ